MKKERRVYYYYDFAIRNVISTDVFTKTSLQYKVPLLYRIKESVHEISYYSGRSLFTFSKELRCNMEIFENFCSAHFITSPFAYLAANIPEDILKIISEPILDQGIHNMYEDLLLLEFEKQYPNLLF